MTNIKNKIRFSLHKLNIHNNASNEISFIINLILAVVVILPTNASNSDDSRALRS